MYYQTEHKVIQTQLLEEIKAITCTQHSFASILSHRLLWLQKPQSTVHDSQTGISIYLLSYVTSHSYVTGLSKWYIITSCQ